MGPNRHELKMTHQKKSHAGGRQDAIDHWACKVRDLELSIREESQEALRGGPTTSFFVFFSSQRDAAIAAQTSLLAQGGHAFRVTEAPGPEEVSCLQ